MNDEDIKYWRDGTKIIEDALAKAQHADPGDVPFPLLEGEAIPLAKPCLLCRPDLVPIAFGGYKMNISIHRWPPEPRGGQQCSAEVGVLIIDDESGHAVACISERSQQANVRLAKQRLVRVIEDDAERKELRSKIEGYVQRLAACNRTVDDADTLDAYRQNELREMRALLEEANRTIRRQAKKIEELSGL